MIYSSALWKAEQANNCTSFPGHPSDCLLMPEQVGPDGWRLTRGGLGIFWTLLGGLLGCCSETWAGSRAPQGLQMTQLRPCSWGPALGFWVSLTVLS